MICPFISTHITPNDSTKEALSDCKKENCMLYINGKCTFTIIAENLKVQSKKTANQ